MGKVIVIADRSTDFALPALLVANALFLLSFIAVAVYGSL
jgi:hypothetical protein